MTRWDRGFWRYPWDPNDQTKAYLRLDGARIAEDTNASEKEDGGGRDPDDGDSPFDGGDYGRRKKAGFVAGPLLFALVMLALTPAGLDPSAQAVGAVTAWGATWWMSEAIPIPATSLLPIVLFPLTGALDAETTTAPYADPLIFLFMGGFFLSMAMQRWDLHWGTDITILPEWAV